MSDELDLADYAEESDHPSYGMGWFFSPDGVESLVAAIHADAEARVVKLERHIADLVYAQPAHDAAIRADQREQDAQVADSAVTAGRLYNPTEADELADARARLIRDRIRRSSPETPAPPKLDPR